MSRLEAFFKGWSFRTNKPSFEAGQEIAAVITGYDANEGVALVRVGDTVLQVSDGSHNLVNTWVRLRIEEFDVNEHIGRATVLERIGEGTY